uniref:Uncharacterized protein n=1 Tax=Tanacetum cinerariifolium TaxID=118510 RepID=A0A699H819_TANCI|nr:hypothetical protein [Tanacetum cinerariifolium]
MGRKPSQKKPILIIWIIMTPIRALGKVKKLYVKGMTTFGTTYNRPTMIMKEANRTIQLPRSFSTNMLDDDRGREQGLVRATSAGATQVISMADIERYMIQRQIQQLQASESRKNVPRSCSAGMGRIDEDRASSFRDDTFIFTSTDVLRDSRSRLSRNLSHAGDSPEFPGTNLISISRLPNKNALLDCIPDPAIWSKTRESKNAEQRAPQLKYILFGKFALTMEMEENATSPFVMTYSISWNGFKEK